MALLALLDLQVVQEFVVWPEREGMMERKDQWVKEVMTVNLVQQDQLERWVLLVHLVIQGLRALKGTKELVENGGLLEPQEQSVLMGLLGHLESQEGQDLLDQMEQLDQEEKGESLVQPVDQGSQDLLELLDLLEMRDLWDQKEIRGLRVNLALLVKLAAKDLKGYKVTEERLVSQENKAKGVDPDQLVLWDLREHQEKRGLKENEVYPD